MCFFAGDEKKSIHQTTQSAVYEFRVQYQLGRLPHDMRISDRFAAKILEREKKSASSCK